ncbi:MAG: SpoIIE family protein phosphatase [Propionibacteriaceae bacterium]|nr:SpoIIE family protein phosphatase [Propionibacteriaceae bacterium]
MTPGTGLPAATREFPAAAPGIPADPPPVRDDSGVLVPPRAEAPRPARRWISSPTGVLVVATLAGIFALGWLSEWTRPAEAVSAIWWPVSGLALGLGVRTPKRHLWLVSAAVALVLLGPNLVHSGTALLGIAASVAAGVEVAIGALILRAGVAGVPSLKTYADLGMLLLAVVTAATAYDLTVAAATFVHGDVSEAITLLFSAGPRRAAGMLLVTPLFLQLPAVERKVRPLQVVLQVSVALLVSVLVFLVNHELPISFVAIVPPMWGAITMAIRWLLVEMLGIAAIASYGSATGQGAFAFPHFGPDLGGTLLQAFELTMVTIVLVVALTVASERTATARLGSSELLYRSNFETSLAGMLVLVRDGDAWQVQRHNDAAAALLPRLTDGVRDLAGLLGEQAAARVTTADGHERSEGLDLEIESLDGRQFQMGVVPLELEDGERSLAVQFLDITDSVNAKARAAEELQRAAEVQRALSPAELPSRAGWEHGAAAVPAREVGGDFYDLRIEGRYAVIFLGDVMGKGIGSGILAAATRTALRSGNPATRPADALADSVRIIDEELTRSNAFVTLGYATVDLLTGRTGLVDAGHGLSFLVRNGGTEVERLAGADLPLGLGSSWGEQRVDLAPGDSLLMVSDGVLEGWGDSVEDLVAAIKGLRADPAVSTPQVFAEALCRGADPGAESTDDATAVLIHRSMVPEGARA